MRIQLIQPPSSSEFIDQVFMHEPLALEYLGAGLKIDGHEVLIQDTRIEPDIKSGFGKFQPDIVGITGYTSQIPAIKEIASCLKLIRPDIFIIVGGHHATVQPEDFNLDSIDLIVIGEGVVTLREIVKQFAAGKDFNSIPGLAIPDVEMYFSSHRPYPALDELPTPDRSLTARYRQHYFSEWLKPLASIRTSLGCTGRCNFCALWSITGGKYLRRKAELVITELKTIKEKNIFFCDDESMCDVKRMDQLADLIKLAGIRKQYFLYARVDTIIRHHKLLAKWRAIGLKQVFVGMESFSDERLKKMNKEITVAQQEQAVEILKKLDILMYASFVVDPDFSKEDFRSLAAYIRHLKLNYASFSILTPLPGTELYISRQTELLPYKPELYDFIHTVLPTKLPLPEFYAEYAKLYQKAVPLHKGIMILTRYGFRRMFSQIKLLKRALTMIRNGYLDH